MYRHLLTLTASFVLVIPPGQSEDADTILINGHVLTMDKENSLVEAVAVRGDQVLSTGSTSEIRKLAGSKTQVLDLEGRTVIPGIIAAHCHAVGVAAVLWGRHTSNSFQLRKCRHGFAVGQNNCPPVTGFVFPDQTSLA